MVWVAMAVIALGVTALLVYLFVIQGKERAQYGSVVVPGEETIRLPAGEVDVYYQDEFRWRFSEPPRAWDGFSMIVSDPTGKRLDLAPPRHETVIKSSSKNLVPYGVLDVPAAGAYTVSSQIDPDAVKPRITFGS